MNAITPTHKAITTGQKGQLANILADAARKATDEVIPELEKSGVLDGDSIQKLQGNPALAARMREGVKKLLAELAENVTGHLRLISGAETLTLGPTDGKATIAQAGNVFTGYLDSNFKNWGCDVEGQPTSEQSVQVYELIENGTFEQIYAGMGRALDDMCLSQDQIIQFVQKHRKRLRTDGYGTFFLFKVGDNFFVAVVHVHSDGDLEVYVYRLSYDFVLLAEFRGRFVLPQLAPQVK